uniref:Ig-like domain-containing protein n=1 Tax=Maylandia zebra TaxID=106582 RepID=A0A3P9D168_9CICH
NDDKAVQCQYRPTCVHSQSESGQDVTLTCRAPNSKIVAIEWSKDLWNLLYYQIGQFDPDNQNPAYKNRVDLKDRQMKDGDVSLILKNVTINDTGTYRCYVAWGESNQEAWLNLICTINLSVVPPEGYGFYLTYTCSRGQETIEHVLLHCQQYDAERSQLIKKLGSESYQDIFWFLM